MSCQGEIMRVGIIGSRTYENKRKIREMIWKLKNEFVESSLKD